MLDLVQGTVAWTGRPFDYLYAQVTVDQGRYYVHSWSPAAIAVLDGQTGKVVARTPIECPRRRTRSTRA